MDISLRRFLAAAAFVGLSFCLSYADATTLTGRIVGIADGDTATLLIAEKREIRIRLDQIDAPEKDQAFGQASKRSLSELIFGKSVTVQVKTTDRYGRTVGTIVAKGLDVNREQIRRGMAWAYRKYLCDPGLLAVEASARNERRGLWDEPNPLPPWEFRIGGSVVGSSNAVVPSLDPPKSTRSGSAGSWSCGNKDFCKQMTSCDEAKFYLKHCGVAKLDGDGDGLPCDNLCR